MKTFSEFIAKDLSYKVSSTDIDKIFKNNDYKRMSKGGRHEKIKMFGDGRNILFSYNEEDKELIVKKQGWQLMNIKRGF